MSRVPFVRGRVVGLVCCGLLVATTSLTTLTSGTASADASAPITLIGNNASGPLINSDPLTTVAATSVSVNNAMDTAVLTNGDVLVADSGNNQIRRADSLHNIYPYAGSGTSGCAVGGDLSQPRGVTSDGVGGAYVSTGYCGFIEHITADGNATLVAGQVLGQFYNGAFAAGTPATQISLNQPAKMFYDVGTQVLYTANQYASDVIAVQNGTATIIAGTPDRNGYTGDGGPATSAKLNYPGAVVEHNGVIYIADSSNGVIRAVDPSGIITTLPALNDQMINGLTISPDGKGLYVAYWHGRVTRIDLATGVETIVSSTLDDNLGGLAFDALGNLDVASATRVVQLPGVYVPPAPVPTIKNWVALGDSYSSGEGVAPFIDGTHQKNDECHRSTRSYSEDIAQANPTLYKLDFHACSGAVINDFYGPNHSNPLESNPQLSWVAANTDIVTFTIGGNDVHFADAMRYCATRTSKMETCQKKWQTRVDTAMKPLKDELTQLVSDIKNKAPDTKIYLVGYPRFFPVNPPAHCSTGAPLFVFGKSDMQWINTEISNMDTAISAAATASGVSYVNSYDMVGATHDLCGTDRWINLASVPLAYSYHPNAQGQQALSSILISSMSQ